VEYEVLTACAAASVSGTVEKPVIRFILLTSKLLKRKLQVTVKAAGAFLCILRCIRVVMLSAESRCWKGIAQQVVSRLNCLLLQ
jgi:hypothetical protein